MQRRIGGLQFIVCFSTLCLVLFGSAEVLGQTVPREDTSDWWSFINPRFPDSKAKLKNKDMPAENFRILGLDLKTLTFEQAAAKLGKARIVERGSASIWRSQACYVSVSGSPAVHLIFEYAEDETLFYLFSGGADWKGSRFCVKSDQISAELSTASGLRLGLTPAEVETILGKPDVTAEDRYIYARLVERKFTPEAFERFRKEHPKLAAEQARSEFDFPQLLRIEVRFADSGANYLAVAMNGTADG